MSEQQSKGGKNFNTPNTKSKNLHRIHQSKKRPRKVKDIKKNKPLYSFMHEANNVKQRKEENFAYHAK